MIQMNVFEKNKLSMHSLSSRSAVEERNKSYSNIVHVQCIMVHIFQKAQVALNKNAHNLQHHFGAQFFMLFHMVWFILYGVLGQNHFLIGWSSSTANQRLRFQGFLS